jgi:hypothetical protein
LRINKVGGWSEYWSADSILEATKTGPAPSPSDSGASGQGASGKSASGEKAA